MFVRPRAASLTPPSASFTASRAADRSVSDTDTAPEATQPACLRDPWRHSPAIAQTPSCHTPSACLAAMEMERAVAIQRRQHGLITVGQPGKSGLPHAQVRVLYRLRVSR